MLQKVLSKGVHSIHFFVKTPVELISRVFEDNLGIILLISPLKHMLWVLIRIAMTVCCGYSLESPRQGDSNEYPKHVFYWRTEENYPSIIIKYPPYLFHCKIKLNWTHDGQPANGTRYSPVICPTQFDCNWTKRWWKSHPKRHFLKETEKWLRVQKITTLWLVKQQRLTKSGPNKL